MKQNRYIARGVPSCLVCPVCRAPLFAQENSIFCLGERRHCFDIAKEGYVNLMPGRSSGGDSPEAVRARSEFLSKGYYKPLLDCLAELLSRYGIAKTDEIIDAGCGEGYYGVGLAREGYSVQGFDLSRAAVATASSLAAREGLHTSASFAVASVFDLPAADGSVAAVVNIFAPCAEEEYARVLREGGYLFVVGAGREHLMGLKHAVYDAVYENEGRADMPRDGGAFAYIDTVRLSYTVTVEGEDAIQNLFSMTPYYWRTNQTDKKKLDGLHDLETPLDFEIFVYRKRGNKQ